MASTSSWSYICRRLDSAMKKLRGWRYGTRGHGLGRPTALNPDHIIDQLETWRLLATFLIHLRRCSDADNVVSNFGFLVSKIEAVSDNLANELGGVLVSDQTLNGCLGVADLLRKWERTIGLFREPVGQVLDDLSGSCTLGLLSPALHSYSIWIYFLRFIPRILSHTCAQVQAQAQARKQVDYQIQKIHALRNRVEKLFVQVKDFQFAFHISAGVVQEDIHDFFTHVGITALRIAIQALIYLVRMGSITAVTNNLMDLKHDIDPTTPEFLDLNLAFLRAVKNSMPDRAMYSTMFFIHYLLGDSKLYGLKSLGNFVVDVSVPEVGEEKEVVQSLLIEIKAVLIEAGCLCNDSCFPIQMPTELHRRICLLKLDVFFKQQLSTSMPSVDVDMEDLFEDLKETLDYQRNFSTDNFNALIVEVATDVPLLYESFRAMTNSEDRLGISFFLLEIVLFKVELICVELEKNASLMAIWGDGPKSLLEGLRSFATFVINTQQTVASPEDVVEIFTAIEAVARRMISLHYSSIVNRSTEDIIKKMTISFKSLVDKMAGMDAKLIGSTFPRRTHFPKIDGMGFIDFFLGNLQELLRHDPDSIALVKHQIKDIQLHLEFLRCNLELDTEHLELKDLGTQAVDVAYEAEYIIDSIEVGTGAHWQHLVWLYYLLQEIKFIETKACEIHKEKICDARAHDVTSISRNMASPSSSRRPESNDVVLCLSDREEAIIDRLTGGPSQRDVVSIVGMPGIGKTTVAMKLYNDPKIAYYFHIRAWCSVSQVYEKRELLLEILSDLGGLTDNSDHLDGDVLELKLYQLLKQKRYLIVMDDVWDIRVWNDLESSFPNDGNGSRILMTSRLYDVALKAKPDSVPISHRLFSDDESWELLQLKIFQGGCPKELLEAGKEIARNCQGLPLAIVAIAGLLERTEKKLGCWKAYAESLSSRIMDDPQSRCMEILQQSYQHLPEYLKLCFLYFGAFVKDKDIVVNKLSRLWISEGFIRKSEEKSLEDLAEDYLMDLIHRSLVLVSKKGSKGNVKACRIHDMLRDLCLSTANKVNLLQLITREDEPYASFDDLDHGADLYDYNPSDPVLYEKHRLSICLKHKHFVKSNPSGLCTRSLIYFATNDAYPRRPYDISFISNHFKFLRVLDLESINIGVSFPSGIEFLVQLRYLAVGGDIDSVPSSISKLWKLETFVVKGLKGKVILPATIWCMVRLRHLHVTDHVDFDLHGYELGDSSQLGNLVTFSD